MGPPKSCKRHYGVILDYHGSFTVTSRHGIFSPNYYCLFPFICSHQPSSILKRGLCPLFKVLLRAFILSRPLFSLATSFHQIHSDHPRSLLLDRPNVNIPEVSMCVGGIIQGYWFRDTNRIRLKWHIILTSVRFDYEDQMSEWWEFETLTKTQDYKM